MQGHPGGDRNWEHWPGRGAPDEGFRKRLRALFAATDSEDAIEALIAERGREIQERTEQLQATIADLERREEQTGRLRSAVEEMLRHGSAELDERHAELAALALELGARDERVRAAERDVAVRRQELGAVELRRAAVERREGVVAEREAALVEISAELKRRDELAPAEVSVPTALRLPGRSISPDLGPAGHILYVPGVSYRVVERDGQAPGVGEPVEVDGLELVVTRVGRSPLPGDGRECAYLEPAAVPRQA